MTLQANTLEELDEILEGPEVRESANKGEVTIALGDDLGDNIRCRRYLVNTDLRWKQSDDDRTLSLWATDETKWSAEGLDELDGTLENPTFLEEVEENGNSKILLKFTRATREYLNRRLRQYEATFNLKLKIEGSEEDHYLVATKPE